MSNATIDNLEIYPGDIGLMDWDEATKACAELGDGWRMPTKDELNEMYLNRGSLGGFTHGFYWSSTETDTDLAWYLYFTSGNQYSANKTFPIYVRPVRDKSKDTTMSGYRILGNLEIYPNDIGKRNWYQATLDCEKLHDGWRLPTQDELNEMYLDRKSLGGFEDSYYWSSSVDDPGAWLQNFNNGNQILTPKPYMGHVRPVRDKPKETNNDF